MRKVLALLFLSTFFLLIVFPLIAVSPTTPNRQKNSAQFAKILFVGDFMFDRGIRYYASKNSGNNFIFSARGEPASGWETLSDFLKDNDLVVANLEGPITSNKSVSSGTLPGAANNYYFTFDPSVARTLFEQNIKLVNLGNNHILNFGREGLADTKNYLDSAGVGYFGASDYLRSASQEIKGVKITLINYNEFSDLKSAEIPATLEEIQKAKKYSDIIIVYAHWGVEYAVAPTGQQKDLAHIFIDEGADLIIGSHPHVIQPMEIYKQKRIYYSLGNFIFDQYFSENVRTGLAVTITINKETLGRSSTGEPKQLNFSEQKIYLQSGGQTILLP